MIETSRLQDIPTALDHLSASSSRTKLLSVHLDTTPGKTIGQAYRIWFRDACHRLREQIANGDPDECQAFDRAIADADAYVQRLMTPDHPGMAIFTSGDGDISTAVPLPSAPQDLVAWGIHPAIEPLVEALDDQERIAVVLVDKERTRLFTIFLGEIEERHVFVDDVPGKQATGDWFGLSQGRYLRHHEDHVLRHLKRTIRALIDELRVYPYDRLFIGGSPEATSMLIHQLPPPLRNRYSGALSQELLAPDAEVLTAALAEAAAVERRYELAELHALLDASSGQGAAAGLDPTLELINERRVHRLFVSDRLETPGGECPNCERLTLSTVTCPVCGGPLEAVPNVAERAVEMALAHGSGIEMTSGDASSLLMEHGGLAAWVRY